MSEVPAQFSRFASRRIIDGGTVTKSDGSSAKLVTLAMIKETLKSTTGGEVDPDAPLMESGLDSLGAVELGNQLQAQSGMALPSTLIFDYPTARQLAGYFKEQAGSPERELSTFAASQRAAVIPSSAKHHLSSRTQLPASPAKASGTPRRILPVVLSASGDVVTEEVPAARWTARPARPVDDEIILKRTRYGALRERHRALRQRAFLRLAV